MVQIYSFVVFLVGLAVGSFLNSVIYRFSVQEGLSSDSYGRSNQSISPFRGRSFCTRCGHALSWQDLVPVFSFVLLRGKCRYCSKPISFQYPLVELATGFLFLFLFIASPCSPCPDQVIHNLVGTSFLWAIASLLVVIFVYDLKYYLIPDKILYPAIGIAAAWRVFEIWDFGHLDLFRISDFGFGILPTFFFLGIFLFSRGQWMGFGDVKLAVFMGLFLGWPNILVALFIAFLLGAGAGIALILARKKNLKSQVPFGPFLIGGTFFALFFGSAVVNWYLGLLMV